ncbi:TonB family protein [Pseudochelatococcus sp. G4_1912]|uniref:TonB family protein n=1 Tax=Pseudochelatococcus sp. G4_1912 TaxID=3114288 RepID=UPI0039C6976C
MSVATFYHDDGPEPRALLRWVFAAVVVLGVHAGLAAAVNIWGRAEPPPGEPAAALIIDLMPMAAAPDVASDAADPGPVAEEAPPPQEAPPVKDLPPVNELVPPVLESEPLPPEPAPDLVETPPMPEPAVSLPPPPPERPVIEQKPEPEKPKPAAKKASERPPSARPPSDRTTAPPSSRGQPGTQSAAPSIGGAVNPSATPPSWRSAMLAHLNRHKRYPVAARQRGEVGVARLQFTMDRSGKVLSYQLLGSAGSPLLDQEAVAMIQRASPLPAIPPEVSGGKLTLTVPVRFNLR